MTNRQDHLEGYCDGMSGKRQPGRDDRDYLRGNMMGFDDRNRLAKRKVAG
jgi:hypothetical protein